MCCATPASCPCRGAVPGRAAGQHCPMLCSATPHHVDQVQAVEPPALLYPVEAAIVPVVLALPQPVTENGRHAQPSVPACWLSPNCHSPHAGSHFSFCWSFCWFFWRFLKIYRGEFDSRHAPNVNILHANTLHKTKKHVANNVLLLFGALRPNRPQQK